MLTRWIARARRVDKAIARMEARMVVALILILVGLAGVAATIRTLARYDVGWAKTGLQQLLWMDEAICKTTVTAIFFGASLATHHRRHIGIDLLLRVLASRGGAAPYVLRCVTGVLSGLITLGLAYCFALVVGLLLEERSLELTMLHQGQLIHVCDGPEEKASHLADPYMPTVLCALRKLYALVGLVPESLGAAAQVLVPMILVVMGLRLLGQGIGAGLVALGGPTAIAHANAERRPEGFRAG